MKIYKFLVFALLLLLMSCREDVDEIIPTTTPTEKPKFTEINASVLGLITDEDGEPLTDVLVLFESYTTTTDDQGYFQLKNINFYKEATSIIVEKDGYFKSSKTIYPTENETSHFSIALMEKTLTDKLISGESKSIITEGLNINFDNPQFIHEDGSSYSGSVNTYVKWLNPVAENLSDIMPGDLVGIDLESNQQALQTFGMLTVELETESGQELELAAESNATIEMEVPAELLSQAPAQIPLWHFDTEIGLWIEEGVANLQGDKYVGEVGHFSFWNCDAPFPLVNIEGYLTSQNGNLENVKIKVTDLTLNQSGCTHSGTRGIFNGKVPKDHELLLEVISPCGDIVSSGNIGPYEDDVNIGAVPVLSGSNINISGSLSNCDGTEIENGYVNINFESGKQLSIDIDENQSFQTQIVSCLGDSKATALGVDITNNLISAPIEFNLSESVNLGTLNACDEFYEAGVYLDFNNGTTYSSNQDTIGLSYQVFDISDENRKVFTVTILDWLTANVSECIFELTEGETDIPYTFEFDSYGFTISGTTTGGYVNGGLMISFSDKNTDIQITDPSLYDDTITEVEFTINLEL